MRIARRPRWDCLSITPPARPVRPLAVAALAALALAACQDPAGVGLGLIDEEQSDPSARVVPLTDLDTVAFDAPAIGIAAPSSALNTTPQSRVLVGDVVDVVFGDVRSIAYVDFLRPSGAADVEADEVREVWLQMVRSYTYGDTTATLPVSLHPIQGSWEASQSYPRDTVFSVGAALSTTNLVQADSLVRFDLPASWVEQNAALLLSATFADDFEGFALQPAAGFAPAPGVVFGLSTFAAAGARLQLAYDPEDGDADTLSFPLSEVFSSIATQPPSAAAGYLPLRRSSGAAFQFAADLGAFSQLPLARGLLRLPLETSLAQDGAFVRPLAGQSTLFGVRDAESEDPDFVPLGILIVDDDLGVLLDTRTLTRLLQQSLLDPTDSGFDRYEIRPDPDPRFNPASLDILPVRLPTADPGQSPRLTLTLVGAPA